MSAAACKIIICSPDFAAPCEGIREFAALVEAGSITATKEIEAELNRAADIQGKAAHDAHTCLDRLRRLAGT